MIYIGILVLVAGAAIVVTGTVLYLRGSDTTPTPDTTTAPRAIRDR